MIKNKKYQKTLKKPIDKSLFFCYNNLVNYGRLAQLGEHLPYKQRVTGSSPVLSTKVKCKMLYFSTTRCKSHFENGLVAQLVRALACHARGRGFEPHPSRHSQYASVAQLVEQGTENPRVVGSIPTGGTIRGFSSFGRAPPCQGGGGGFEPRNPLHNTGTKYRARFHSEQRHQNGCF